MKNRRINLSNYSAIVLILVLSNSIQAQSIEIKRYSIDINYLNEPKSVFINEKEKKLFVGDNNGRVYFYDLDTQYLRIETPKTNETYYVAQNSNNQIFQILLDGSINKFELKKWKQVDKLGFKPDAIANTKNGQIIALLNNEKEIAIYDANIFSELGTISLRRKKKLVHIEFLSNSNTLVGISRSGQIYYWDINTLQQTKELTLHGGEIYASRDVIKTVFINSNDLLVLLKQEVALPRGGFSNSRDLLREDYIVTYDLVSGSKISSMPLNREASYVLEGIDGNSVILKYKDDEIFRIYELESSSIIQSFSLPEHVNLTYTSESGKYVIFITAEKIYVWEVGVEVELISSSVNDIDTNLSDLSDRILANKINDIEPLAGIWSDIPTTTQINDNAIAVVIGNKNYQNDVPDVDYAINDAKLFKEYLVKTFGFKEGNIIYIENAGKATFESIFGNQTDHKAQLFNYVKSGISDVFIYYSGHGSPDVNSKSAYLMPVDSNPNFIAFSGYSVNLLYENLQKLNAKSVAVFLDACFSGASGSGEMLVQNASPIGIKIKNAALTIENSLIITASSGEQISSWYPEKRHGLFTYFLLKGIKEAANINGDRMLTVEELINYLSDQNEGIPYYARRIHNRIQTPTILNNGFRSTLIEYR